MPAFVVGLGEILWDLLPSGPVVGGAPFNFTFHCHQLGQPARMVSRIGRDHWGERIGQELASRHIDPTFVQIDDSRPTGTVQVHLDAGGQPSYVITPAVAWDAIAWDAALARLAAESTAVCFGTLAQREPISRATIQRFVDAARAAGARIVYDINLRQHFYDRAIIETSLHLADWLKLNDQEIDVLTDLLALAPGDHTARMRQLRDRYGLALVCLTRGADGCLVQTATEQVDHPGFRVRVVDTVGAGDAFTAGLVCRTLEGQPLAEAVRFASKLASEVAARAGGTPTIDRRILEP